MKYEVRIQDRQASVELEQQDSRVHARVGSRQYDLEVVSPEDGAYTFLVGERVFEARVWGPDTNSLRVNIGGHLYLTSVIDRKNRRSLVERGTEGRQTLIAPMPGKVVRVLLGAGEEVMLGQGVVIVEAMKMQNEIKSPKTGRVVEVRVAEGANVNANQVLAVVE